MTAKGRSEREGQYATLSYSFLNSEAWRTLRGSSVKVFLELRTRFHGGNNGRLFVSLEEAAGLLGLGKATVMRAFEELEQKGLVVCTKRGHWYGRQASEWSVTDQRVDGLPPTNAWKQWQPGAPRPSVLKWTKKSKRGAGMKPSASAMGPPQNPAPHDGSATAPVAALRVVAMGSEADR